MTAYHRHGMSRLVTLLFLALSLPGCGDATGILVEVRSTDLGIPSDVDALRIQAVSVETGRSVDRTFSVATAWPHSLTITPATPDDRQITVTVTALREGRLVVRRVVQASFTRGVTNPLEVVLTRACVGVECPPGVDCIAGMCVDLPTADGGVDAGARDAGPEPDGGEPDGGPDAGAMDGGPRDGGRDAGPPDGGPPDAGPIDAGTPILFFSEYVEGSSLNKALEITNVGDAPIALSRCALQRFSNGDAVPTVTIGLTGTLAVGDVHVICNGSLEGAATRCDELSGAINHNGDDAYALVCDGVTHDTFGQIGFDPGTEWTGGGLSTFDYVLRRECSVMMGDTVGSDAFDPSVEWTGEAWVDAATSLTGLGNRSECP